MERHSLVHRDIKPANIIVFGPELDFKLADFGLSRHVDEISPSSFQGTPEYCSPILFDYYNKCKKTRYPGRRPLSNCFKDDVYSLGLTIKQLLKSKQLDDRRIPDRRNQGQFTHVLNEMLEKDELRRPTFEDLMKS